MDTKEYTPIDRERGPGYMTVVIPVKRETAILMFENKHGYIPDVVLKYEGKSGTFRGWMLGPVQEGEL